MIPRRLHFLRLATLALVLTACTVNFNTIIEPDGSGLWQTEVGLNPQDIDILESSGSTVDQFCNDLEVDVPEGASVVLEERGDERWCVAPTPFASLDELRAIYSDMDGMTIHALALEGDEVVYDIELDLVAGESGLMGALTPNMSWVLTMPGRVLEHNAHAQDGRHLTWDMQTDKPLVATARSSARAGPALPNLGTVGGAMLTAGLGLCCCTGLLGALGGGAFVFLRRRQEPPAAPADD